YHRHLAGAHALRHRLQLRPAAHTFEGVDRAVRTDAPTHVPERLIELCSEARDVKRVRAVRAGEYHTAAGGAEFGGERCDVRRIRTRGPGGLLGRYLAGERAKHGGLGARTARDPLVSVEPGEGASRAHVDEAGGVGELSPCIREGE